MRVWPPRRDAPAGVALAVGGSAPAAAAGIAGTAVAAVSGGSQAAGAAAGALLAIGAMDLGPLVLHTCSRWSPPALMAAAVGAYGVATGVLGAAFVVLGGVPGLDQASLGICLAVTCLVWLAGAAHAAWRLRVHAYDLPGAAGDRTGPAAATGPQVPRPARDMPAQGRKSPS